MDKRWPNGKKVAVTLSIMYETWSEGTAPTYSVHASTLKPGTVDHSGHAWSTYGARVGIWRILHSLNRLGVPATVFPNARCAELYPDLIKQAVYGGHDIGAHAYTQDGLLSYMTPDQQRTTMRKARDILGDVTEKSRTGGFHPCCPLRPRPPRSWSRRDTNGTATSPIPTSPIWFAPTAASLRQFRSLTSRTTACCGLRRATCTTSMSGR